MIWLKYLSPSPFHFHFPCAYWHIYNLNCIIAYCFRAILYQVVRVKVVQIAFLFDLSDMTQHVSDICSS